MDQIEKIPNDKITKLENEIKVLKNEVQAVLLDLRESYLNMENPFNSSPRSAATQSIVITERAPVKEMPADKSSRENQNPEPFGVEKSQLNRGKSLEDSDPEKRLFTKQSKREWFDSEQSEHEPINSEKENNLKNTSVMEHRPENIVQEKMARTANPAVQPEVKPEAGSRKYMKLDLVTMAGLTGWVEQSAKKIGRERTEAVLEISETMGYVSPELKLILVKLIALAHSNATEIKGGTRDYMDSLIKLNSLLGNDNREETALLLLSLVTGEAQNG
jgi:hypothetical protein